MFLIEVSTIVINFKIGESIIRDKLCVNILPVIFLWRRVICSLTLQIILLNQKLLGLPTWLCHLFSHLLVRVTGHYKVRKPFVSDGLVRITATILIIIWESFCLKVLLHDDIVIFMLLLLLFVKNSTYLI